MNFMKHSIGIRFRFISRTWNRAAAGARGRLGLGPPRGQILLAGAAAGRTRRPRRTHGRTGHDATLGRCGCGCRPRADDDCGSGCCPGLWLHGEALRDAREN